ncbi:MAG: hypothetical protein HYZ49_05810 [Chloroflexi bacterium]|nr:hypothetical protein [Chloroflexota bacterium]
MTDLTQNSSVHLQPGAELQGENGAYVVEHYLGEGVTAVVYLARNKVTSEKAALKVLRLDASEISVRNFSEEGLILGSLRLEGTKAVPLKLDQQKGSLPNFMVLELVDGKEFPSLDELEDNGVLPELEGLELAEQALEVLDRLHTGLRRTYTDMQFKNFCWNRERRQLKVMDWNHVSAGYRDPDDAEFIALRRQDLARFASYIYRYLTGKLARDQGTTARALEKRAGDRWSALSAGTRQLLTQALHPNPARRYASAKDFLLAVKEQHGLLGEWSDDLFHEYPERFKRLLQEAEVEWKRDLSPDPTQALEKAKWLALDEAERLLDALARHDVWDRETLNRYQARLQKILEGETATWVVGRRHYNVQQYAEAANSWEPEAKARGHIHLWRWLMLARAGAEMGQQFEPIRPGLESVIAAMKGERWDEARDVLEALHSTGLAGNSASIQTLRAETNAVLKAQTAAVKESSQRVEDWQAALDDWREVEAQGAYIPYWDLLKEERDWAKLPDHIAELDRKIRDRRARLSDRKSLVEALENYLNGID